MVGIWTMVCVCQPDQVSQLYQEPYLNQWISQMLAIVLFQLPPHESGILSLYQSDDDSDTDSDVTLSDDDYNESCGSDDFMSDSDIF